MSSFLLLSADDTLFGNAVFEYLSSIKFVGWIEVVLTRRKGALIEIQAVAYPEDEQNLQPGPKKDFDESLNRLRLHADGFFAGWQAAKGK